MLPGGRRTPANVAAGEAVNCRDDEVHAGKRGDRLAASRTSPVTTLPADRRAAKLPPAPREHANRKPAIREATTASAECPGSAGNEDHDLLAGSRTTARRTASFTSARPVVDRLEVEARPAGASIANAEDDDAAHDVRGPVTPRTLHLPFRPHRIVSDRPPKDGGGHIGNHREDLLPVPADLGLTLESTTGVRRRFVPVSGEKQSTSASIS